SFDDQLGKLVAALRERRLLERKIVVVVADHGEAFLEHGSVKHCRSVYDAEGGGPLLVRLPQQRHGREGHGAGQILDVVTAAVGRPVAGQGFEGRSLTDRLDGAPSDGAGAYSMINAQRALADDRYKLVADLGTGSWQLFDLRADPGERKDVKATAREPFARL